MEKEALFYKKDENGKINCKLCPHNCLIKEGSNGICGVRKVENGLLYSLNYGKISSMSMDPIEKKPLYHFKPGSQILSIGSFGCNFKCGFCQNYSISQKECDLESIEAEDLISLAKKQDSNIGIAFTYNEPSIWYEYMLDVCRKSENENLKLVMITNGYINRDPLENLLPYISAANVDLKAFNKNFYNDICYGNIDNVLENIQLFQDKCHLEITTLIIEGFNDSENEIRDLSKWIASINPNIPLHLSRYFPRYKFTSKATSIKKIKHCAYIAREYLNYVYIGNIPDEDTNTYCPKCKYKLIDRSGLNIKTYVDTKICPKCGYELNIVL